MHELPDLLRGGREFVGAEHEERQEQDDDDLTPSDVEHAPMLTLSAVRSHVGDGHSSGDSGKLSR